MTIEIRECRVHGLTEFYVSDKTHSHCKRCNLALKIKRRRRKKQLWVDYLGGECCICGYKTCLAALEFHHRDPSQKLFSFSQGSRDLKWEDMKPELDKCNLVCANCHREIEEAKDLARREKRLVTNSEIL